MKSAYLEMPLSKPSKTSIRKQAKVDRQKNINLMETHQILWFVYKKHEVEILYLGVVTMFTLLFLNKIGVI